ncbi:MAG: protein-tyrosine-phosphatase [Chthoniobacteraceae bacterium]
MTPDRARERMKSRVVDDEGPIRKLLFICSRNRLRSLTAEKLFEGFPPCQARSAGTQPDARIVVTAGHLGWADIIFCMEKSHLSRLRLKFPGAMQGRRVVCLHIPDEYEFMQPELLDELRAKLAAHVALPAENSRD